MGPSSHNFAGSGTGSSAGLAPLDYERSAVARLGPEDGATAVAVPHFNEEDTAPLLVQGNRTDSSSGGAAKAPRRAVSQATLCHEQDAGDTWATYAHEAKCLTALAAPLIASSMSGFLVSMIGVAFVGRLGKEALSTAVLATSLFNVTGLSFLVGSLGALETLCGQAYGARNYRGLGATLQRAVVLTGALGVGVCALWTQAGPLMVGLGQDPALSAAAARFLHLSMPALLCLALAEALKRYLMAQNIVAPAVYASGAAVVATPLYNWVLIYGFGLGLDGAALALNLAQATPLAVLLAWTARREAALAAAGAPERTWYGWSWDALRGWVGYLRLAVPSAAVVCLEWWTFEACVLMAGWLPAPELEVAVMGLSLNISGFLYMIPVGLGSATSVRVGNALGAGLPRGARRAAHAAAAAAAACQMLLAGALLAARGSAALIFSSDVDVVAAAAPVFPIMALCLFGDGINATLGGMLRGAARQELGAALGIVAFWALGLPLAAALAFKAKLGVPGLWAGLSTASSVNAIVMLVLMWRMDWAKEAERASTAGAEAARHGDLEAAESIEFGRRAAP